MRSLTPRPLIFAATLVSIVCGVTLGLLVRSLWLDAAGGPSPEWTMLEAVRQIKASYVEEVADEQLVNDALHGMLRGLDQHSRLLNRGAVRNLQLDMGEESPAPAFQEGHSPGSTSPFPAAVPSINACWLEPGYPYVRISQFGTAAGVKFRGAINALAQQRPIAGLVLDLRRNAGGMLASAVEVADAVLDGGLVTYTQGRSPPGRREYRAGSGDVLAGAPMVVLIDRGSASAAEVVAGAFQGRGRAVVLGERSLGKGSVQSVLALSGGLALKLTTAHYFTPEGKAIQGEGIAPDAPTDASDTKAILAQALALLRDPDQQEYPRPGPDAESCVEEAITH